MNNDSTLIKQNFELRKENIKLKEEKATLKKEIKRLNVALSSANLRIKQLEEKYKKYVESEEERIQKIVNKAVKQVTDALNKQHKKEVDELEAKISRLEKRLNLNSSNSGIPTSKDRIGFNKIQNNREKSTKKIGAQEGHEIHKLEYFKDDEITEVVEHTLDKCPKCGGSLIEVNVVKSDVIDNLSKQVKNEPHIALDGGKDGLNFYKIIIDNSFKYLKNGGKIFVEIGFDQKDEVINLFKNCNFYKNILCKKDLGGNDRMIIAEKC